MKLFKIVLLTIIFIVFITICGFIGLFLDKKDRLKKQLKILENKGYKIDTDFIGKGLCNFNIYLDSINKKVMLFDDKMKVYNFDDLKNYNTKNDNIDGTYTYNLNFQLGVSSYKIVLSNVSDIKKNKYEELIKVLDFVNNTNNKKSIKSKSRKKTSKI